MTIIKVSHSQVAAWRLRRQHLVPRAERQDGAVEDIVERLAGVQAQVASSTELAVAVRQRAPRPGSVRTALADRTVMRTWAMRGTLHVLVPDQAAAFLSLMGAARTWEKPAWQRSFGATPAQMARLGETVAEVLADGRPRTRQELIGEVLARPGFGGMAEQLNSGWGTLLKPLAWTGRLCHGPGEGGRATFVAPTAHLPGWRGVPEPEEAAPAAIAAYLRAHGPATAEAFDAWLIRGLSRKAALRSWFAGMDDRLATVEVDGVPARLLAEDVEDLASTEPGREVLLLGGFDQYVLGPGTGDARIVPPHHRGAVSRTAGWISPVVVHGGRVAGVWEFTDTAVEVRLFPEAREVPTAALEAEAAHLALCTGVDRPLSVLRD
ncbi:winged helix DNA-binding domain-containing protein [Streptomyces sp. URMC 123]|uniref:winged helix DNA-binding domain-containing protein n=1 Tax=Streptomyces sp. URMC 123 TaxID=3423403 RepID=UPI003F1A414D